jgi:hypothetical protein
VNYGIGCGDVQILVKVLLWLQGLFQRVSILEVYGVEVISLLLLNLVGVLVNYVRSVHSLLSSILLSLMSQS